MKLVDVNEWSWSLYSALSPSLSFDQQWLFLDQDLPHFLFFCPQMLPLNRSFLTLDCKLSGDGKIHWKSCPEHEIRNEEGLSKFCFRHTKEAKKWSVWRGVEGGSGKFLGSEGECSFPKKSLTEEHRNKAAYTWRWNSEREDGRGEENDLFSWG